VSVYQIGFSISYKLISKIRSCIPVESMALPILGYERIIVITFLVVCIGRKHASAPAENTLTIRLADSTARSLEHPGKKL
jgi:hypothetical protein